jgi:CheY-like chemotaxis protein
MIDDVLDLSRIDIVGFTLNREPTHLETLLRETVESVEGLFRGRPVHLDVEITDDLPTLELDRTRIRQVLLNLLNNAARFTEEGAVRVEAKREDGEVVISVCDTGPGIPQDQLPHMFQEFYQVDRSLSRRHGRTGLGLAISRHFVEAHNGRIWVTSEEGAGSTFTFTLPIPGEHVLFSRLREERPLALAPDDTPAPIVVLDPDPAVIGLIGRHLEAYEVVQVAHADRLADTVALHHPRAVVCNVRPGQQRDGATALSTPVPIIECSLPSQAWVAQDLAVIACLTKPVTADHLLVELDRLDTARDILIVDDDIGFCQLVERLLEASGRDCAVRRAYDGTEGLLELHTRTPDVLLLDLIMPGMDGFQMLEEMQQDAELVDVPVVLLTATSFVEDALAQHSGQMVVRRPDGLKPGEVLRCLGALIEVLEPHYDERSASETVPA